MPLWSTTGSTVNVQTVTRTGGYLSDVTVGPGVAHDEPNPVRRAVLLKQFEAYLEEREGVPNGVVNLMPNPTFTSGSTTGYAEGGGTAVMTVEDGVLRSTQVSGTGGFGPYQGFYANTMYSGFADGDWLTLSGLFVDRSRVAMQVRTAIEFYNSSFSLLNVVFGTTPAPGLRSVVSGQVPAGTFFLNASFYQIAVSVAGDWAEVDQIQLTKTATEQPYVDGDMAAGRWVGTPNFSASLQLV